MASRRSKPIRIDVELEKYLREIADKNGIKITQASRELARSVRYMKGRKFKFDVTF